MTSTETALMPQLVPAATPSGWRLVLTVAPPPAPEAERPAAA